MKMKLTITLFMFLALQSNARSELNSSFSQPSYEEQVIDDNDKQDWMQLPISGLDNLVPLPAPSAPIEPSAPVEPSAPIEPSVPDYMKIPISNLEDLEVLMPPEKPEPQNTHNPQKTEERKKGQTSESKTSSPSHTKKEYVEPEKVSKKEIKRRSYERANQDYKTYQNKEGVKLREKRSFSRGFRQAYAHCDSISAKREGENEAFRLVQEHSKDLFKKQIALVSDEAAKAEALRRHRNAVFEGVLNSEFEQPEPLRSEQVRNISYQVKNGLKSLQPFDTDTSSEIRKSVKTLGLNSSFFGLPSIEQLLTSMKDLNADVSEFKASLQIRADLDSFSFAGNSFYRDLDSASRVIYRDHYNLTFDRLIYTKFNDYINTDDVDALKLGMKIGNSICHKNAYQSGFDSYLDTVLRRPIEYIQPFYEEHYRSTFRRELNIINNKPQIEADLRFEFVDEELPKVKLVGSITNIGGKKQHNMKMWQRIVTKDFIWESSQELRPVRAHSKQELSVKGKIKLLNHDFKVLHYSIPKNSSERQILNLQFKDLAKFYLNLDENLSEQRTVLHKALLSRVKLEWQTYSSWFHPDIWSKQSSYHSHLHELLDLSKKGADFTLLVDDIQNLSRPLKFLHPRKNRNFKLMLDAIR